MNISAKPVNGDLEPLQQIAVDGPYGPPMYTFVCNTCNRQFPDVNLYFHDVASTRCMWCTKFPKKQKQRSDIKSV